MEGEELIKHYQEVQRNKEKREREEAQERRRQELAAQEAEEAEEEEAARTATKDVVATLLRESFDLYLGDDQDTALGGRRGVPRMFPAVYEASVMDDYGLVADSKLFAKDALVLLPDANVVDQMVEAEKPAEPTIPTKEVEADEVISLRCKRAFVNMEGLSDGVSMLNIVRSIAPNKLVSLQKPRPPFCFALTLSVQVIVGASEANTQMMVDRLKQIADLQIKDILTPSLEETVDASSLRNMLQARLTNELLRSVRTDWKQVGTHQFAYVSGAIRVPEDDDIPVIDVRLQADAEAAPVQSDTLALERSVAAMRLGSGGAPVVPHRPVHVGSVALPDLRGVLERSHTCQMGGGVLLCDDVVEVRKTLPGETVVEAFLSPEYFAVRKAFATVDTHAVI